MDDYGTNVPPEQRNSKVEKTAAGENPPTWRSGLDLLFSGLSGISALAVTILAFYGAFFTTLPEQLIGQLRTDVTLAQREAATAISAAETAGV